MADDESERGLLSVIGSGASTAARAIASAYHAIDPDLRWHALQAPLAGLSALTRRPPAIASLQDDGYRPVIWIHGLGGHPGNFVGLRSSFSRRGRTRTYTLDLRGYDRVEDMATLLGDAIDRVAQCNDMHPEARIDLVAHSMGGLVARLALDSPRARRRVANLVTLGTPHEGSHLARLAATNLVLALRPGSELLTRLKSQDFWGATDAPLLTAVWSQSDTIVIPADSARFDKGRNIELEDATHYSYLLRPSAWKLVWDVLLD